MDRRATRSSGMRWAFGIQRHRCGIVSLARATDRRTRTQSCSARVTLLPGEGAATPRTGRARRHRSGGSTGRATIKRCLGPSPADRSSWIRPRDQVRWPGYHIRDSGRHRLPSRESGQYPMNPSFQADPGGAPHGHRAGAAHLEGQARIEGSGRRAARRRVTSLTSREGRGTAPALRTSGNGGRGACCHPRSAADSQRLASRYQTMACQVR